MQPNKPVQERSARWPDQAGLGRASRTLIKTVDFILKAREGHENGQLCNQMNIPKEEG